MERPLGAAGPATRRPQGRYPAGLGGVVKPLRVLNVMVSHGVGGTQFAFVRYGHLFERLGYDLTWCVTSDAAINSHVPPAARVEVLPRSVQFSPLGLYRAAQAITHTAPDV